MAEDDPYLYLEDRGSYRVHDFVSKANQMSLGALGDPTTGPTYEKILNSLRSDERIPFVSKMGTDDNGEAILYNFWKDSLKHPRGIWRKTTLSSYESDNTDWKGVLDLDKIAEEEDIPWVWRGIRVLPRCRDPSSEDGKMVRRAMITLQREASNTVSVREFDLLTSNFVTDDAFSLPEGRSRVSYKGRDVLYVASDLDGGSLTTAGNPLTVREWTRGTLLEDAPVVFEGRDSDIGASSYIDDQRLRGGDIFEVQIRSVRLNSSDFFVRKVKAEHLLAKHDPRRKCMSEAGSFQQLQLPGDSQIDFVGNLLLITLCSDWSPEPGEEFKERSVIYVNAHKFIKYGPVDRIYHTLFQPSKGVVCETYHVTKQFLVLSVRDKIKSKLEFYKLEKDANKLRLVGMDKNPQIRVNHVQPLDPYDGDGFWLTTSGYTEPTTVWLADAAKMDSKDKKLIRKTGSEEYMVRKLKALPNQFDSSDIHVMQKFVPSMDGTEIPYFLLMKKGTQLDRSNPTLLYAYGGFGVTLSPNYAASIGLAWLERGGVYAEANIRGGGEFGPGWHKAAIKSKRNKSYEDFIAVAEDLIAARICEPKTLAIRGGLNGGLLVANVYVNRPDLFGAVHCAFPLLDMKRYKTMSGSENWVQEFGDPDTKDWDKFLKNYSPYHNINEGVKKYPPILFTTCSRDQRAHPGHTRKMVKKLWDLGRGKRWPAYFYETLEGGSDDAKQYAFTTALGYDFLYRTLSKNAGKAKRPENRII